MIIQTVSVLYFSPTGTTKKILEAIVNGMNIQNPIYLNFTFPEVRNMEISPVENDILIIGVPVYEERIPKILYPALQGLRGYQKPVVLVAVYGNIGSGIVLNELQTITEQAGFTVVAAGEFIGEHSFSTPETPIAEGRPDEKDLIIARDFGESIIRRLEKFQAPAEASINIPNGTLPLMAKILPENSARMFTRTPVTDMSLCNHCGVCVKLCPVSAITKDTLAINEEQCLRCFSCVKRCPKKARKIIYKKKFLVSRMLRHKGGKRNEPRIYI